MRFLAIHRSPAARCACRLRLQDRRPAGQLRHAGHGREAEEGHDARPRCASARHAAAGRRLPRRPLGLLLQQREGRQGARTASASRCSSRTTRWSRSRATSPSRPRRRRPSRTPTPRAAPHAPRNEACASRSPARAAAWAARCSRRPRPTEGVALGAARRPARPGSLRAACPIGTDVAAALARLRRADRFHAPRGHARAPARVRRGEARAW